MKKIYLASNSPRRQELLKQMIGNNFEIILSDYEEDNNKTMKPCDLVVYESHMKCISAVKKINSGVVIASDTIAVFEGKSIGKPKSLAEARDYLNKFSNNELEVISGFSVIDVESGKEINDYEITKIKFAKLDDETIENYLKIGESLDKAGGFGIQGRGSVLVEKVDGCYFNVVGLPINRLYRVFLELGVNVFDYE